jgi:long-chain acyl-CoA synthetase
MSFADELMQRTAADRDFLLSAPVITRCLRGDVDVDLYIDFLTQAYHHVRHTVPLLEQVRARLTPRHEWLRAELDHYIEDESGHERWILDDIAECGGDVALAAAAQPAVATEAMVAYAYDTVTRGNPIGFFGMVFVLEGTSVALAVSAADTIRRSLALPARAFTYLRSHGELDQEHIGHLRSILERLPDADDREAIVRCAKGIYWLYGQMFRGLDTARASRLSTQPQAHLRLA